MPIIASLHKQIASCEATLIQLRQQLSEAEHTQRQQQKASQQKKSTLDPLGHDMDYGVPDDFRAEVLHVLNHAEERDSQDVNGLAEQRRWPLEHDEYRRYGRQLIMPEVGLQGQLRLREASVLVVGVGGLGCPAAAYLVGAGVGSVGLVDGDVVEESNLHRQILHSTARVGMTKVESAMVALNSLNPNVKLVPHKARLSPENAISIFKDYDIVLDCTDTPASRYLISDTCVATRKPLISASALRIDGQLMVLNNPPLPPGDPNGGPCYRCIFPKPPPPETVVSCGDGGILGPVVGVMGVLQALEAIKVLTRPAPTSPADPPTLLLFSAYSTPLFRSIRLRARKPTCAACSSQATITPETLHSGATDYVQFCGLTRPVDALTPQERVSADSYAKLRSGVNPFTGSLLSKDSHILVDVRERVQFELCSIDGSINIPFSAVSGTPGAAHGSGFRAVDGDMEGQEAEWVARLRGTEKPIFVVCRLGNDSQVTVRKMKELGLGFGGKRFIGDIRGGLSAWRDRVDGEFPNY
ncbi:molybdopterin biosynthesis protein moeB [Dothidotthia symphoricarpi CBS 119687]|uniref:Adenylyltransferase and sulfurtransferase uba4 n=1 Tax=Dothidotthia symphoricarpi CBS 119687 TaxID=1392245 RepID=A0A6A6A987_9PLEO|nr:molybdopterin biosynthesis protein moeB [Dothidotthia symphoricarpi CBS 119687]KAF2128116.1 molybdopterin biosynthesis protein moeB [Dothidotthia symphoricarpi CBS 119687]